jgi:cathepsin L
MIYKIVQLFAFFAFLALAQGARVVEKSDNYYREQFELFKVKFNRTYLAAAEHGLRFDIFKKNLQFVESHDAAKAGFSVAINEFADLSSSEFAAIFNGYRSGPRNGDLHVASGAPQADVDWRQKGAVTHVKNQGQCGSCWSFSATGSIEGAHKIKTGQLVSFSEQNLVDCSQAQGNMGCNGGLMDYAFKYVISNRGLDTESSYPYEARQGSCRYNAGNSGGTISSYKDIPSGSESSQSDAVSSVGPVSVAIDASHPSFQMYHSGIYYEPRCSSSRLDHGVLAVGYGDGYWLVKNSWGTGWGQSGYIQMARNRNNHCGIATESSYPVV